MEPNSIAYLQYLSWSIDQLQTDAATDMDSLDAVTITDVDMDSLTAATATDISAITTGATMIGTLAGDSSATINDLCGDAGCGGDPVDVVDDVTESVTITGDDSGDWLASTGDPVWSGSVIENDPITLFEWSDYDVIFYTKHIKIKDLNCTDGQFVTIKDQRMVCVTPSTLTIIQEVNMWTVSNIVVVAIVATIVYKVMPKLTLRNFFRACWKLVIHPFKKKEEEITATWKDAEDDTRR